KPFLQIANLKVESKSKKKTEKEEDDCSGSNSTSKLDFALASGNNSTLFDHEAINANRVPSPQKLSLDLLTFQMFSVGGRIGKTYWNGHCMCSDSDKNAKGSVSSLDAPCVSASMAHSFIRGKNLLETIHLNMLTVDDLQAYSSLEDKWQGRPLWELFPQDPKDEIAIHNATRTFIGRMVPLSRSILINSSLDTMLLGNGLSYPVFGSEKAPFPPEPSATIVIRTSKKESERKILSIQPDRAFWRQLHAIALKRQADGSGGCLALSHLDDNANNSVDIVVCGLARDQANIVDSIESTFSVPAPMLRKEGHDIYEEEIKCSEEIEYQALAKAIECWRLSIDGGWTSRLMKEKKSELCPKLRKQASSYYWTAVESNLPILFQTILEYGTPGYKDKKNNWRLLLYKNALNAYNMACGREDSRHLRAYIAGKHLLISRAKKILNLTEKAV
ncbi:MAG: type I-E CRISPR-associated protein Cse1/CasA, partial [Desulfovibrionaceae bacterium]|nr:type I-E CRISPR-associated protein Cse1/CasA [Desulfovibrionaceae bacterium]